MTDTSLAKGFQATVYRVFIASPGDVQRERQIIRDTLARWNALHAHREQKVLLPVGWETHSYSAMGDPPQKILNKQILKNADLLIGVFWSRLGTPTDDYDSGTVEEFEEHIRVGKPAMLYFSKASIPPDSIDTEQFCKLKEYKESCKKRGLYKEYGDLASFQSTLSDDITRMVNADSYFDVASPSQNASAIVSAQLSLKAKSPNLEIALASEDCPGISGKQIRLPAVGLRGISLSNLPDYPVKSAAARSLSGFDLPDYRSMVISPFDLDNSEYYRECANYYFAKLLFRPVQLSLSNTGNSVANNVKLELSTNAMFCQENLPDVPEKKNKHVMRAIANVGMRHGDGSVVISNDKSPYDIEVEFSRIRAGQMVKSDVFYISPNSRNGEDTNTVILTGKIFADELERAVPFELKIDFDLKHFKISNSQLMEIADGRSSIEKFLETSQ